MKYDVLMSVYPTLDCTRGLNVKTVNLLPPLVMLKQDTFTGPPVDLKRDKNTYLKWPKPSEKAIFDDFPKRPKMTFSAKSVQCNIVPIGLN